MSEKIMIETPKFTEEYELDLSKGTIRYSLLLLEALIRGDIRAMLWSKFPYLTPRNATVTLPLIIKLNFMGETKSVNTTLNFRPYKYEEELEESAKEYAKFLRNEVAAIILLNE